jgi:uncharacterized protein YcbX
MATAEHVGTVHGLWRFPVKSMTGERLEEVELTLRGVLGDREHAIIDVETGKVLSAKREDLVPRLLDCKATYVEAPKSGQELPPVRITLPNGTAVISDSSDVDRTLSDYFGRSVRLVPSASAVAPRLHPGFFADAGARAPDNVSPFVDLYPVSVITTATLAKFSELTPASQFDVRRFRMNVIVGMTVTGFPENDWIGREVALGDAARLKVMLPDPRCVLTTLAQDELRKDPEILRAMVRDNTIQVGKAGPHPCAGVYTDVVTAGTLRVQDSVVVT